MDVTLIAFLVLLGGTPAEHVIQMPSMYDCWRAGESVSQYECLDANQFDARLRGSNRIQTDMQTAAGPGEGDVIPTKATVSPVQTDTALNAMPSAVQRRVRKALYPQTSPQLTTRESRGEVALTAYLK